MSPQKSALIVRGPRDVKKRELVFLQFRLNQSSEDFSAIDYLLFSSFQEFLLRWPQVPAGVYAPPPSGLARPWRRGGRRPEAGRPAASGQRPARAPRGCEARVRRRALCHPRCLLRGARGGMVGSAHGRGCKGEAAASRWLSTRPFQLGSEQSLQRGRRAESCREA